MRSLEHMRKEWKDREKEYMHERSVDREGGLE